MGKRQVNYKNIRYGMLVEVLNKSGYHSGCKVHFYNRKGALIGNYYKFMTYDKLRMRDPKNRHYPLFFHNKLKCNIFKIALKITDLFIRITQRVFIKS